MKEQDLLQLDYASVINLINQEINKIMFCNLRRETRLRLLNKYVENFKPYICEYIDKQVEIHKSLDPKQIRMYTT